MSALPLMCSAKVQLRPGRWQHILSAGRASCNSAKQCLSVRGCRQQQVGSITPKGPQLVVPEDASTTTCGLYDN
jgi:hypothetical protein